MRTTRAALARYPGLATRFHGTETEVRLISQHATCQAQGATGAQWPRALSHHGERYLSRRRNGLCGACGQRKPAPSRVRCAVCLERRRTPDHLRKPRRVNGRMAYPCIQVPDAELQTLRRKVLELRGASFREQAKAIGVSRDCLRNALRGGRVQAAKRKTLVGR